MSKFTGDDVKFEMARRKFIHFLPFCRVLDPPPLGHGILRFEIPPHIEEVTRQLETETMIVWVKARQIFASWTMAAYDLWTAMYHDGAQVLLFSQGEPEAQDKLGKCRFIYTHLPDELRETLGKDNAGEMNFPDRDSRIRAFASTSKAGRSATGTLVDMDEADFHEYFEENYNAVLPVITDNKGQMVLVSTSNPDFGKADSLFKKIARTPTQYGFKLIFYGWDVRAGRTPEWLEAQRAKYDDPYKFLKEYPPTLEAALAAPSQLTAFTFEALELMEQDLRSPLEDLGDTKIYSRFRPGHRYCAGADTAHGVGADFSVMPIIDCATLAVVADVMSAHLPPEEFALACFSVLKKYDSPILGVEDNDWGGVTLKILEKLGYNRLYERGKNKPGWRTNRATKPQMWGELIALVNSGGFVMRSEEGLRQFHNVVKDPDTGIIMSVGRAHDDYPTACAIALQMRPFAYVTSTTGFEKKSSSYKWGSK